MADKISWIDANGNEYPLSTQQYFAVLKGTNGRFMPPLAYIEEDVPLQAGSRLRQINIKARDIDIPLLIKAGSEIELRQLVRECLKMFNPMNGDGRLKVIAPDGSQREIYCRYISGLEGKEDSNSKGDVWQTVLLVFRAFDPYWYDASTNVQTYRINESTGSFFPFFPLRLSSSTVFAEFSVNNTGDVESRTEWIIQGPADSIIIRNLSTGEVIEIITSLQAGEYVRIDTAAGKKTVKKGDGTNLFGSLSADSSLWSLQTGQNSVQVEISNATEDTMVQLSYRNRYWGS